MAIIPIPIGAHLDRLISTLSQSKIQTTNPALYQTIFNLIKAAQSQINTLETNINNLNESIENITNNITSITVNPGNIAANGLTDAFSPPNDIFPIEQFVTLVNNAPIIPSITSFQSDKIAANGLLDAFNNEECQCMPFIGNIVS